MRNPYATDAAVLAVTQATIDAAKLALVTFLQANPDKQLIADATCRAQHAALADDRVWNVVRQSIAP